MKNLDNKVAVVTGAASGIGRALAQDLAAQGCRLALADVDEAGLGETARLAGGEGGRLSVHRLDVSDRAAVDAFAEAVEERHGPADVVINNAGVTAVQSLLEVTYEDFEWVMGVNFWGVVYGTKAFLPQLLSRPEGSVVNISSVNAFLPFPHNGPYNCSKYAVCGFNETLHQELGGSSVVVTSVHPGGIKTRIAHNARVRQTFDGAPAEEMGDRFVRVAGTTSERAAEVIREAIRHKKRRCLIGPDAYLIEGLKRLAPQTFVGLTPKVMAFLQRRAR